MILQRRKADGIAGAQRALPNLPQTKRPTPSPYLRLSAAFEPAILQSHSSADTKRLYERFVWLKRKDESGILWECGALHPSTTMSRLCTYEKCRKDLSETINISKLPRMTRLYISQGAWTSSTTTGWELREDA